MKHLIFICTGNTCRSPMAEVLFKRYLQKQHLSNACLVESRGLMAVNGEPASQEAKNIVQKWGADLSQHTAKTLQPTDLTKDTYFICMTQNHANAILPIVPKEKIFTLQIADPYGQGENVYAVCAEQMQEYFPNVMQFVFCFSCIRNMQLQDVDAVAEIEKASFSVPWTKKGLEDGLKNDTALFLVAENNQKAIAYIGANQILDEVYLNNLAVLPAYRRKGVAKALLLSLISVCTHQNASFVSLEVRKTNEDAIALYELLGFEKQGLRKNFYHDPIEDALILTKYLK